MISDADAGDYSDTGGAAVRRALPYSKAAAAEWDRSCSGATERWHPSGCGAAGGAGSSGMCRMLPLPCFVSHV